MAVPIIRGLSLLRHRLHLQLRLHLYPYCHREATTFFTYRLWSTLSRPTRLSDHFAASSSTGQTISVLNNGDPSKIPKCDDTDSITWKDEENEMLKDIEPVICAAKRILHSDRYLDGECLTADDEKLVLERLLAYHPHSEDKIGCGIDSIMAMKPSLVILSALADGIIHFVFPYDQGSNYVVTQPTASKQFLRGPYFAGVDRHPQFRCSRCLFVVRSDGGWIDFSYQKCLRSYIRQQYPSHAERFIKKHLKRGSS